MLKKWVKRIGLFLGAIFMFSVANPFLVYHVKRYDPVNFADYYEYSGVIGVRTKFSDGALSFRAVSKISDALNLHFVITTDINTIEAMTRGLDSRFGMTLMIPAVEISADHERDRFLVVGDSIPVLPGKGVTVDSSLSYARRNGSLVILDHASNPETLAAGGNGLTPLINGMELYNFGESWAKMFTVTQINKVFGAYMDRPFNEHSLNYVVQYPERRMKEFDRLNKIHKVVGVGVAGTGSATFPSYEGAFKLVHTIIVSKTPYNARYWHDRELTLEALRRGHMYVSFPGFESARGFFFTATSGDSLAMMGDSLRLDGSATIRISLPDSSDVEARLFKNGELIQTYQDTGSVMLSVNSPGQYRVEVFQKRFTVPLLERSYPWILSNPIYIYKK